MNCRRVRSALLPTAARAPIRRNVAPRLATPILRSGVPTGLVYGLATALVAGLVACAAAPPAPNPAQQSAQNASQAAARALARGDLPQARSQYEAALLAAESVEDFQLAGAALLNLALVHARAADLTGGHARLDRMLAAPQRYGPAMVARASTRKALLYLDAPDLEAALTWADAAEAACTAPCELGASLANLRAHVALQRGDAALAAQWAGRAVALATEPVAAAEQANAMRLLGRARSQLKLHDEAGQSLAQALAIDQRLGLPERVALDLVDAAENEQARGRTAAAREFFERALVVYQAMGQRAATDRLRARLAALGAAAKP